MAAKNVTLTYFCSSRFRAATFAGFQKQFAVLYYTKMRAALKRPVLDISPGNQGPFPKSKTTMQGDGTEPPATPSPWLGALPRYATRYVVSSTGTSPVTPREKPWTRNILSAPWSRPPEARPRRRGPSHAQPPHVCLITPRPNPSPLGVSAFICRWPP